MSIEKIRWDRDGFDEAFEITCDECGECEEIDGDFNECIDWTKENGWKTVKEGRDWCNYCPECQEKPKEEGVK